MGYYAIETKDGNVTRYSQNDRATMKVYSHTKKLFEDTPGPCSFWYIENLFEARLLASKKD